MSETTTAGLSHEVTHESGAARAGVLTVRGRTVRTPAFLAVGTYGSVKGLPPDRLR